MSASDSCFCCVSLSLVSFNLFISNAASFSLPPSSMHSLNFALLLCLLCCHTVCNCLCFACSAPELSIKLGFFFLTFCLAFCSLLLKTHLFWLLCFPLPFPISSSAFPSLPQTLLFFLGLKWMVFLRKSVADFCWARGPECHSSRLIYPPPLSSCYAWSLNFPFLLFFLCFCSQIPPLILPRPPPFSLIFHRSRLILSEHDTCSLHTTGFPHSELSEMLKNMSCWTAQWP